MKNFKFKINGKDYNVAIEDSDSNIIKVNVNGTEHLVELDREVKKPEPVKRKSAPKPQATANIPAPTTPASGKSASAKSVLAPLPGSILDINVKKGDTVKNGDVVLVMEAMKMENNIITEHDGVISEINVSSGQTVMQNDLLIEIE